MHPSRPVFRDRVLTALAAAPLVAAVYALVAYSIFRLGCTPPFVDVDFFGVPVTVFLLAALTLAALVLIAFAGLHLPRALKALAHPAPSPGRRAAWLLLGGLLAAAAFLLAGALGLALLNTPCP